MSNDRRKKSKITVQSSSDNGHVTKGLTSVSRVEVEDISEEVEARLRMKEDKRKRKLEKRGEKRKRDSTTSNVPDCPIRSANDSHMHKKLKNEVK